MLASYDADCLRRFILVAVEARIGEDATVLRRYLDPALRIDMRFAIAFAAALILGNLAIAPLIPIQRFGVYLALSCAVTGAAYEICDVQADRTLERAFAAGLNFAPNWRRKQAHGPG